MLTGELISQVDKIWETFWTGGIANPLTVIEQFTYLLFLRRLDERQTLSEKKANLMTAQKAKQKPQPSAMQFTVRLSKHFVGLSLNT